VLVKVLASARIVFPSSTLRASATARAGGTCDANAEVGGAGMHDDIGWRLPSELRPLLSVAGNLWWSWQPDGADLFRDLDPERWDGNPVKLLRDVPRARLEAAARDAAFVGRARELARRQAEELARPAAPGGTVAFFCAEYGLHRSLPIYSGGLGALAGDLLKQASDSARPMVGVGLFYRRGYFHQRLDPQGWQHEYWVDANPEELPMRLEAPRIALELRGRRVEARIWRVDVGRVPLYLLDADVPENDATSRWITATLYVGDRTLRLTQYALLAIGGVRALRALGITPSVVHLNEGHAALAAVELGVPRPRVVFTTHTPVGAGNERYDARELEEVVRLPAGALALAAGPTPGSVGMTELALRSAAWANGVSRRHGEVARAMWRHLWPARDEAPIAHVTNGVHLPTWMAPPVRALLDRHLGPGWADDPDRWARIAELPDEELWAVRNRLRAQLVERVRRRSIADRLQRGESLAYVEGADRVFDPGVLTIGFARRLAAYKRLHLLVEDPARALALLRGPRPLQVLIAGKAHPRDEDAKRLLTRIFALKNEEAASTRVIFLEDQDLGLSGELTAGCDVWVNLPRPPLEASGTSGMKAALSGGLNLSVLDGWWCEGYEPGRTGWAIASDGAGGEAAQDARDAAALYDLLEREVVPAFYDRDAGGVPRAWLARVKASLHMAVSRFTARRMLAEYVARAYPEPGGGGR
jgi:starch phosphorylase